MLENPQSRTANWHHPEIYGIVAIQNTLVMKKGGSCGRARLFETTGSPQAEGMSEQTCTINDR